MGSCVGPESSEVRQELLDEIFTDAEIAELIRRLDRARKPA
jgi:hypothetical protein